MSTLGDLMVKVGADISGFSTAMKSVIAQIDEVGDKVEGKFSSLDEVGARLATLGAEMTVAITVPLEEMGRRALETAAQFEQVQVAFTTFLGSATAAHELLGQLYQFAATTPFEVPGVLQGGRTLLAMGFAASDVVPIMRTLGDAASGLGVGQAGLERFVFHLGQIKALGHIDGMILREMGQNGVAASQMIADYMGKSVPEITKMVTAKDPSLDSTTVINALMEGMNDQFGGAMNDQMGTLAGQWSNFKDQITLTAVQIGNTLLPMGKELIGWASDALNGIKELSEWFANLPAPIQNGALALAAMATAAGPVLAAIGGLGMTIPVVLSAITPIAAALGIGTVALFGWTAAIAVAVAGLAALGTWIAGHWDGVKAAVVNAWDGLAEIWNATLEPLFGFREMAQGLEDAWQIFKSAFLAIWDVISNYVKGVWSDLKSNVIDPMMSALEKIPGVAKLMNTGKVFSDASAKTQAGKADSKSISDAESTMHLGSHAFRITGEDETWAEKHKAQVDQYTKALATLRAEHDKGKVSTEELAEAEKKYQALLKAKPPKHAMPGEGKPAKVDRNAMDAITGQHTHEEAMLAMERARAEHDYQMGRSGAAGKVGVSAEEQAQSDIAAAQKRKDALDALAAKERTETLANLEAKLKIDKEGQTGHQAILNAKQAAEDKYNAAVQKNAFELETVQKQAADRIAAAQQKQMADDLAAQQKSYEMKLKTVDLEVQADEKKLQQQLRQHDFEAGMADKRLQFELETGTLSKDQYLRLKQEQYDDAYQMEMSAIQKEREEIEKEFAALRAAAQGDDQKRQVEADYRKRIEPLNERQQSVQNKRAESEQDTRLGLDKNRYDTVFKPMQSSFASGISGLIKGTQTFQQAWVSMSRNILGSWIDSISQMASKWVTHLAQMGMQWAAHKLMELTLHVATNQAKVASDAMAASESNSISLAQHLREVARAAAQAAAKTFAAVSGIPIVGPVLAPVAAAAAFAGVMAFGAVSAEGGAVLPNHDTLGFLHPQEMVLPKHISTGLQNLIGAGGLAMPNASSLMNMQQGGGLSSTAMQALRNTVQASGGDTHHNYNGDLHYHASPGEKMTHETFGKMFKSYVRQNNLQMA